MLPLTEDAWREQEDERTAAPYGGYGNAIAQEANWHHAQGLPCPFDCARCDPATYEPSDPATYGDVDDPILVLCGHCKGRHTVPGVRICGSSSR